jgi:hypothetical protein
VGLGSWPSLLTKLGINEPGKSVKKTKNMSNNTQRTLRIIEAAISALSLAALAVKEWQTTTKPPRKVGEGKKSVRKVVKRKAKSRSSLPSNKALRKMDQTQRELKTLAKEVKKNGVSIS